MKKFIAWTLVLVLCLGMFAGCAEKPVESTPAGTTAGAAENEGLEKAAKYLKALYNTAPVETGVDYERTTVVPVGKVKYTVTWAADVAEDLVKIVAGENNTVTVDVNEDNQTETPYKLTATVSDADGNKKEVVFDHILPKAVAKDGTEFTVLEIIEMGAAKEHNTYTDYKYKVTGVITEVYNTQYGNMYITDGEGNTLTIYGTFDADGTNRYDAMAVKPVAGDTVTIYGIVGQYNGTPQIKNGWIVAHTPGEGPVDPPAPPADEPAADTVLTVEQAIALGAGKAHDTYTVGKYYVTGIITEVYNEQYGNMKIKDAAGNILTIYGTYSADGSTRYDAMATKPVAGDEVTIYGIIGQYNGTPQIKNGWITKHTPAGGNSGNTGNSGNNSGTTTAPTLADALAAAAKLANDTYLDYVTTITGKISKIDSYNENYKSYYMYVNVNGTEVYCYSLTEKDGKALAEGDTVTVSGHLSAYNGTPQFTYKDSATTVTLVTDGGGKSPAEADPNAPVLSVVETPEVGKAYKLGMINTSVSASSVYYINGEMAATYYFGTVTDPAASLDVYLEETAGGYYMYTMLNGAKTYINMEVSGTHVNGKYQDTAKTIYTWDASLKTVVADVDGTPYGFGTRNDKTYTTVGPVRLDGAFICQFYA